MTPARDREHPLQGRWQPAAPYRWGGHASPQFVVCLILHAVLLGWFSSDWDHVRMILYDFQVCLTVARAERSHAPVFRSHAMHVALLAAVRWLSRLQVRYLERKGSVVHLSTDHVVHGRPFWWDVMCRHLRARQVAREAISAAIHELKSRPTEDIDADGRSTDARASPLSTWSIGWRPPRPMALAPC